MADKRISQLVDRGTVANNDVVPIVVSGATTTNKATISSIQTFMQGNLDVGVTSVGITLGSTGTDVSVSGSPVTSSGNITINIPTASATNRGLLSSADWSTFNNKLSSVGLTMPSAFTVSNSPLTANGTIAVTGAGTVAQYIRGDGSLADFPSGGGGGGASVNYYLNGSVSQGTIGGIAYREMNKVPILGAGTDFTIAADGYIASFITDAGDPALLEIPAGNWNFESYFSASSGGGSPSFYIELYKVNSGGTATLIASNSATPELISFGTSISPYFSPLAVPTTVLTVTDRLAVRYYVTHSGRTITLHTENSHLCQIITTFTTGLTALNGLTAQVQNFATGTSGTDFGISSASTTHTFNLPDASASARGVVTTGTQTFAGAKTFNSSVTANSLIKTGGTSSQFLKADGSVDSSTYLTTGSAGSTYVPYSGAAASVNLGVYTLTANAINSTGSGSTSGQINLRSDAFFSLVNGYGTLGSGTSNTFVFYQTTALGAFRGAILSLNSITESATRTYTLPDATGTLALTSDIPSLAGYVTLATTQTITGAKTFDSTTSEFAGFNSTNANGGTLTFRRSGTNVGHIGNSGVLGVGILDDLEVRSGIGKGVHLKTDGGQLTLATGGGVTLTGALNGTTASFTGDITLSAGGTNKGIQYTNTYGSTLVTNALNDNSYIVGALRGEALLLSATASKGLRIGNTTDNISYLSFTSTGAATFSSSVTATSLDVISASGVGTSPAVGLARFITAATTDAISIGQSNNTRTINLSSYYIFGNGNDNYCGTTSNHAYIFYTNSAERMQITSDAYLRMASGSGGIQFNGDTAAANALDDYEEGTWAPIPTSTGATFNTVVNGTYTKIGRLVFITCQLDNASAPTGTLTNEMSITNLPFTASAGMGYGASLAIGFEVGIDYPTGGLGIQARIVSNTTSISFRFTKDDASGDDFLASNFDGSDARIALAGYYEV